MKRIKKTETKSKQLPARGHYLTERQSGNIITPVSKRIIYYTYENFLKSVVSGKCCFICGIEAGMSPFNCEHIIPNWILKSYCNEDSFAYLPNKAKINFSQYKVPCCCNCNTVLGEQIEKPISLLLKQTPLEIRSAIAQDKRLYFLLFRWMCLLFFKTHYKDCFLRSELDRRKPCGALSELYCWHHLYHFHSLVRQHYTHAQISENVLGSMFVFEGVPDNNETFDYLDNWNGQIVMIRVGTVIIMAVLNDSRACEIVYEGFVSKIAGRLTPVQTREMFARLRFANQNLKQRPLYYTAIDRRKGYRIKARLPRKIEFFLGEEEKVSLFKLMRDYMEDLMPDHLEDRDFRLSEIEKGRAQFIFDENDNFFEYAEH